MVYDKEKVYDDQIAPLMAKIVEICKKEDIPLTAQFTLKSHYDNNPNDPNPMRCTTILPAHQEKHGEEIVNWINHIATEMKYGPNGKPFIMTSVVTSK